MNELGLCFECRKLKSFKRVDKGCHTGELKVCDGCGQKKVILANRHWRF